MVDAQLGSKYASGVELSLKNYMEADSDMFLSKIISEMGLLFLN